MGRHLCSGAKLNHTNPVNPHCSRKSFFAKLGGLLTAVGLAPALLAKSSATTSPQNVKSVTPRAEARAVARQEGSF